jgi:hypothetical protein
LIGLDELTERAILHEAERRPRELSLEGRVALREQMDELANDVGRLCRIADAGGYVAFLAGSLADKLEVLDRISAPTAAELVAAGVDIDEALNAVDRRVAAFRARLEIA